MSTDPLSPPPAQALSSRIRTAVLCIGIGFLALLLRLWFLQILEGDRYFALSTTNRLRVRPIEAPRGFILDRHGEILVENRPTFDLFVTPEDVTSPAEVAAALAEILGVSREEVEARLQEGRERPYQPLLLRKDLDERTMVAVEERKLDLPGVSLRVRPVRAYPSGGIAANLLGYVSEVNQAQLSREEFQDFRPGENLGQAGVERRFDAFIRGLDGGEQVEVDARGRALRLVSRIEPRSGSNIYLTIDKRIQEAAEAAFAGKRGTVVAMNPTTGEILAMVSRPSYDPNLFAQRISGDEWQQIATDATHPLQNRAFQAQYPPGSIYKLMVAIAGLESGALTPETKFNCPGYFYLGNAKFDDWKKGGHGTLDLRGAIVNSCNVYFYQAGLKVGIEEMVRVSRAFGLGEPPGLGLGDEARGNLPNPQPRRRGQPGWSAGNTVVASIGQGLVVTSPMQLLVMVSAIANGGTIYRPWVVKKIAALSGETLDEYDPEAIRQVSIKPETLAFVRQAMLGVVSEGTGARAKVSGIPIAGKTGTAQVVRKGEGKGQPDLKDHGWFVSFAPVDNPQIAVVVLVENGGFGGLVAAPVAKAVYEAAFAARQPFARTGTAEAKEPEIGD
ncbi:MAG: penicillin-binding protein 2 [candidate division NC10 bacterium]|nr:penicillin-binding protein 2 [candidate division NC10 bacterium]MBI2163161.1 penicillin-binding protein 2 [candidate division NC10 bacterium]MBI2561581.1 penicillin-binding protein 2 [candidate division NC10 bacterium]MBI3120976.1 penicillin-binding protein 2 [candidate division NC10 bacterium]